VEECGKIIQYGACALPCWITKAGIRKNALGICNTYSFYRATVVTRTHLNITFIHKLPFMFVVSIIPSLLFCHFHTSVALIGGTKRTKPRNLQKQAKLLRKSGNFGDKRTVSFFILCLKLTNYPSI
jgi:hypothetical protein